MRVNLVFYMCKIWLLWKSLILGENRNPIIFSMYLIELIGTCYYVCEQMPLNEFTRNFIFSLSL